MIINSFDTEEAGEHDFDICTSLNVGFWRLRHFVTGLYLMTHVSSPIHLYLNQVLPEISKQIPSLIFPACF